MTDILSPAINQYLNDLLPDQNDILKEMEAYAGNKKFPIIGPQVGRLFYQIARLKGNSHIFEMGSGFGYSAFWFCLGNSSSKIILTDFSQDELDRARTWFKQAGFDRQARFLSGDARDLLARQDRRFDIIFIDVGKEQYPASFQLALKYLNTGGLIIADNVLWKGKVADKQDNDPETRAIQEYNRLIFSTPGIFSIILPLRDGVAISMKIKK